MTDVPEKIWAGNDGFANRWDYEEPVTGWEEYTRTDLTEAEYERGFGDGCRHIQEDYEAGEQLDLRAAQARIKELEATLQEERSAKWSLVESPLKNRVSELEEVLTIAESAMHEHDTACYGYDEENPWTMREWFDVIDREAIAKARLSVPPKNAALKGVTNEPEDTTD
tara:strand:+ start:188 stop:691 length:504 start_codon:yes stop_codon:yes gene_type:complete